MVATSLLSQLVIEPVSRETSSLARNLILEGLKERFGTLNPEMNPDLDDIFLTYPQPRSLFLIGYLKNTPGEVVCTGALIQDTSVDARIVRVSVNRHYRRNKIAGALVQALETHAKKHHFHRILLETNDDWESAIKFYQSLEYHIVEYSDGNCHMKKQLI